MLNHPEFLYNYTLTGIEPAHLGFTKAVIPLHLPGLSIYVYVYKNFLYCKFLKNVLLIS